MRPSPSPSPITRPLELVVELEAAALDLARGDRELEANASLEQDRRARPGVADGAPARGPQRFLDPDLALRGTDVGDRDGEPIGDPRVVVRPAPAIAPSAQILVDPQRQVERAGSVAAAGRTRAAVRTWPVSQL